MLFVPLSSSSITNAASNSEGSGPLSPLSTDVTFERVRGRRAGESVLFELLRARPAVGDALAALARACSSAMRESIAPFKRYMKFRMVIDTDGAY